MALWIVGCASAIVWLLTRKTKRPIDIAREHYDRRNSLIHEALAALKYGDKKSMRRIRKETAYERKFTKDVERFR